MDTDTPTNPVTGPDEGAECDRVIFDDRQQKRVNEIIKDRLERQKRRDAEILAAELEAVRPAMEERLRAELAAEIAERQARAKEYEDAEQALQQERQAAQDAEQKALELEAEAQKLASETDALRKDSAITAALHDAGFIEPEAVKTLTESKFEWSDEHGQYIVRDSSGHVRMIERKTYELTEDPAHRRIKSITLEPMTLSDFYAEYGRDRPYLVKGVVKGGAGSFESTRRTGFPSRKSDFTTLKDKVSYIDRYGLDAWSRLPS